MEGKINRATSSDSQGVLDFVLWYISLGVLQDMLALCYFTLDLLFDQFIRNELYACFMDVLKMDPII